MILVDVYLAHVYLIINVAFAWSNISLGPTGPVLSVATTDWSRGLVSLFSENKRFTSILFKRMGISFGKLQKLNIVLSAEKQNKNKSRQKQKQKTKKQRQKQKQKRYRQTNNKTTTHPHTYPPHTHTHKHNCKYCQEIRRFWKLKLGLCTGWISIKKSVLYCRQQKNKIIDQIQSFSYHSIYKVIVITKLSYRDLCPGLNTFVLFTSFLTCSHLPLYRGLPGWSSVVQKLSLNGRIAKACNIIDESPMFHWEFPGW